MSDFPERLHTLRKRLNLTQSAMAERMGFSMSYVHQMEVGKRTPSDAVLALVRMLEEQLDAGLIAEHTDDGDSQPEEPKARKGHPVLSFAHAGLSESGCYDELPFDWQETIDFDLGDPKGYFLILKGDSMIREYQPEDFLGVTPSQPVVSGGLAVIKLANDGVLFRNVELREDFVRLIPRNLEHYKVEEIPKKQIQWMHRVKVVIRFP